MKKLIQFLIGSVCLLILSSDFSHATTGDATRYIVTIKKIELKNSEGDWVTIDNSAREVDLIAAEPIYSVINKGNIKTGNYVGVRITILEAIKFSGSDGDNKTKEGGMAIYEGSAHKLSELPGDVLGFNEKSPTWNKESEGLATMVFDLDYKDRDDIMEIFTKREFDKKIEIKEDSNVNIFLSIPFKEQVYFAWAGSVAPNIPPNDSMLLQVPRPREILIKVDSNTAFASSDIIEVQF